ncbi:MAG: penicillin-binding protein 1A [Rhodospirillales bacterium]|nr:penicillin-binding protein 1A [Rhodospirillales bacterium]
MFRALLTIVGILVLVAIGGGGGVLFVFHNFGRDLPEYRQLADYEPPVMTRVYGGDGRLLAEYAVEKRVFVPIKAMPKRVVRAFLAAEDKNFYIHPGVDVLSVMRAALINVKNIGKSKRPVGASTITQQVAKNFLLTNEVSWKRKIQEAILAFRIERALSKDRILELYLNEIYLGFGSYGVAAAALNYFDKSMDDLNIAEVAFLAALPKAPNNYNPVKKPKAALIRRNWVIDRMQASGFITAEEATRAKEIPLKVAKRSATEYVTAEYFAEEVRRDLVKRFGEEKLYKGGLSVRTTVDPTLQTIADQVLRQGLEAYDRRHGWRGPIARLADGTRLDIAADWMRGLAKASPVKGLGEHLLAVVIGLDKAAATIGLADGGTGRIPLAEMAWGRPWKKDQKRGPKVTHPVQVLVPGDIIAVDAVHTIGGDPKAKPYPKGTYGLRQLPNVDGALVAMDPHTGRILAMSGGYSFERSQFNRVTQAMRQPGSAFKPFVYLPALDLGYTPSTLILDAPFVIDQGPGLPKWRPANYTKKFYGPSTMRLGVEKSRNLMTVRLAQTIGMEKVSEYAKRFGIVDAMPDTLSMALGSGETTLLRLTTAYAMLVNGGKRVTPTLIDRIQDRHGLTIFRHDQRDCTACRATFWTDQGVPVTPDPRQKVTEAASAYQIVSILSGVVERGTGRRIMAVGKPLAGKTGTTNAEKDTWFIGFSPDLAVGVFVGFDEPIPLGRRETGSSVAAPVFRDFMAAALKNKTAIPFRIPPSIRLVRINYGTGQLARPGDKNVILEAFKPGTIPDGRSEILKGQSWTENGDLYKPATGTGGLY